MLKKRHIKKRLAIKQLKEAAGIAAKVLIEKKISQPNNVLEEIMNDAAAPMLPGLPTYLPHRWTIQTSQKVMYMLLKDWADDTQDNEVKQDNAADFFKYVVARLQKLEIEYKKEIKKTDKAIKDIKYAPVISEVFSPLRRYETTKSLNKFFIDSFAISVVVKSNGSTSEYADWFLNEWTPQLYSLWTKKNDKNTERLTG